MNSLRLRTAIIFAAQGVLALLICWLLLADVRLARRRDHQLAMVTAFQLQVKELQLLSNRRAGRIDRDGLAQKITTAQTLTRQIELLGNGLGPLGQRPPSPTLSNQLESLRQAYLALVTLDDDETKIEETHQALLDLVDQRVAALPPELNAQLKPRLAAFRSLYSRVRQERDRQALTSLQELHTEISDLVADLAITGTISRLLSESEVHAAKETAFREGEELLDRLALAFAHAAEATSAEISRALTQDQSRRRGVVLALFTVLGVTIVLSFLTTRRATTTFQTTLRQAGERLRSAHPALPAPAESSAGEPAVTLHCIEEAAVALLTINNALSASRRQFEELAATLQDWVWMIDKNGICTYSRKPPSWQTLGHDDRETIGQPLAKLLEGVADTAIAPDLQAALAAQTPFAGVVSDWHLANGRTMPVTTSGRLLVDPDGEFQGFILISRDISNQRRAESELARAAQANTFLNQVLELALLDFRIPELMDRFLKLLANCTWLGAQPSAAFFMIDRPRNSLVMTAHQGLDIDIQRSCGILPLGTCLCGRAAQTGKVIFAESGDDRHEIRYHGMAVHGHYCLPVHTVAGEIIGVVVLYLNPDCTWESSNEAILTSATTMIGSIIRRRQAEDGLKELNQELERRIDSRTAQLTAANQELDAFAYSVSHDLRAPLRAIDGFSQALAEDYGEALPLEAHDFLERIRAGCGRMDSLINDLLRLSRLTRGDLDRQPLDLSKIAAEISKEIGAESPQRVVEWRIAPDLTAQADPAMMRAVLNNLLGNAWKYSAKTTAARIEFGKVQHLDQEETFFVKDNGAGFDMRYAGKLFKAFQRLHSASQFAGNGIGLATVQRIIHRHGGRIWAHGQVDEGATFFFTLGRVELKG